MSEFISSIVNDSFVWDAIQANLSGKVRRSNTGFTNINCVMCLSRGEGVDRKQRCGIKKSPDGVGISCFNCGFKTRYRQGELLSRGLRDFLAAIGVGETEIKRLNHKALQYRRIIESSPAAQAMVPLNFNPNFAASDLPEGALPLEDWLAQGCEDPDFLAAAEYAYGRGNEVWGATPFFWTPDTRNHMNKRVIVPFLHQGTTVGWTARAFDPKVSPRYWSSAPTDFLFNNRFLTTTARAVIVVVEGVFDALAIEGVSTLGAKLSDRQALWLNGTGKKIIVVADRDTSGSRLIEAALKHKWAVAFPRVKSGTSSTEHPNWWETDIKDVADAVQRFGRLYTLRSILESTTTNKLEIDIKRRWLV